MNSHYALRLRRFCKNLINISCISILCIVLGACGHIERQAFNRAAATDIKTIALVEPKFSGSYYFVHAYYGGPGSGIAGLFIGIDEVVKSKMLTSKINEKKFEITAEFMQMLLSELSKSGYKVIVLPRDKAMQLGTQGGADAFLDMEIESAYVGRGYEIGYVPTIRLTVKMIKTNNGVAVYSDRISYGISQRRDDERPIRPAQEYFFTDYYQIEENIDRAVEGLRAGVKRIVRTLAWDIRSNDSTYRNERSVEEIMNDEQMKGLGKDLGMTSGRVESVSRGRSGE